jgi:hypothetical protein
VTRERGRKVYDGRECKREWKVEKERKEVCEVSERDCVRERGREYKREWKMDRERERERGCAR